MVKVCRVICIIGIMALLALFVLFTGQSNSASQKNTYIKASTDKKAKSSKVQSKKSSVESQNDAYILQRIFP